MASKLISYNQDNDTFFFGNQEVTDKEIRHAVADALRKSRWSNGPEIVQFLQVSVTVQYVNQMLDFVDANGWFWDSFDLCTGDHEFDWNRITPGQYAGRVWDLKDAGRTALGLAECLKEGGDHKAARQQRLIAAKLFNRADRLYKTGRDDE